MNVDESDKSVEVDWRSWCRLCGKDDVNSISVFIKNEPITLTRIFVNKDGTTFEKELSLVAFLRKHFEVKIKHDNDLPKMMCTECLTLVKLLVNFVERVEKAQLMYRDLQNLSENKVPNSKQYRMKYGLLDKDRQIFRHHPPPEICFLDTKPRASEIGDNIYEADIDRISNDPIGNEQLNIANIKEEFIENEFLVEEFATSNYTDNDIRDSLSGDGVGAVHFDSNTYDCDAEDDMNLAALQTSLNSEHESPMDQAVNRGVGKRKNRKNNLINTDSRNTCDSQINSDTHEGEESFIDDSSDCSQQLKRSKQTRKHGQHSCNQCSRVFKSKYHLESHTMSHLPLNEKRIHPCPYCDKKFTKKESIAHHIKCVHLDERPFICEECGHAVRTIFALREHMLSHSDYAPFECDICHKGFKTKKGLKRHIEIHDEKKHVCTICGKVLNSNPTLSRHLLIHSDKVHKCDYCGREFKLAKTLKNHLITHTGLKPYSCEFCDRKFNNGSTCRVHKKKTHPKELAEFEASGSRVFTKNIPSLETLKAYTRNMPKTEPSTDALLS